MAAISSNVSSGPYSGDGSRTVFPFYFSIASEEEVTVEVNGVSASSALYTVTFSDIGGSVTFAAAPASDAQIMLRSNPDYLQASEFENEGAYNLATVNQINRRAAIRDLALKARIDSINPEATAEANAAALVATSQAGIATAEAVLAAASAMSASGVSSAVSIAAATLNVYRNSAATYVPQGAVAFTLSSAGSGGANGTNILATYTGGNYQGLPTILFDIVGGAVANVRLLDPGLYIGGAVSAPTVVLPGAAGGAALMLTNGYRMGNGSGYWVQSADGNTLDRYRNASGVPTLDSGVVKSIPTASYLANGIAALSGAVQNANLHDERRKGFIRLTETQGLVQNADRTLTAPAGVNLAWYANNLPASWAADRDAGLTTNFSVDIISGLLDGACQIEQYTAINCTGSMLSSTVMDVVADGRSKSITLDPTCKSLRIYAQSSGGAVVRNFGGASQYPARISQDADYLAAQGYARGLLDTVVPTPITDVNVSSSTTPPLTYDYTALTVPAGSNGFVRFAAKQTFVDGDHGVFTFNSDLPLGTISQGISTVYDPGGGHGPNSSLPNPSVVEYAPGAYAVAFQVLSPAGEAFFGINMTLYSPAGSLTRHITNFTLWKGISSPPPMATVPAIVKDYASRQARFETDARKGAIVPITCLGDSETQFSGDQKNWPQWLQTLLRDRADVHPRGVPGDVADDMLLRGGFKACIVTGVAGGVIPATTTPVAISAWDIRPGSPYSLGPDFPRPNPEAYPLVYLNNVLGRIWCRSFDASNPPQPNPGAVYFQRLTPGAAVPVPAGSHLVWQDGLLARNHKIICLGTYNSAASTRTCADAMFAARLAQDGHYRNLLFIPFAVALGTGPTNSYYGPMAAAYPGQVLDINYAPTPAEQASLTALFGTDFTGSATISEMAAGYIPQILKWDNVHFMEPGAYLLATRIAAWVQANWVTP